MLKAFLDRVNVPHRNGKGTFFIEINQVSFKDRDVSKLSRFGPFWAKKSQHLECTITSGTTMVVALF